jgi:DNA gyrase subunit B
MTSSYTSENIKVLDEISHVKQNPTMYIGSTERPTHLIEELLDNSLDECLAGHAKISAILIDTKENLYSVIDNGRGIPIDKDMPLILSTKLFSGGKFKDSKSAYNVCAGLHGIGLVAVNALSDFYIVEIYRDNRHVKLRFENSKLVQKVDEVYTGDKPFSTKIQFKPSKKVFESLIPDIERLRKRLLVASVEMTDCTFVLNVDNNREVIKVTKEDFFKTQCLSENDTDVSSIFHINSKDGVEEFNVSFGYAYTGPITPKFISSVNLLPVDDGGVHVNLFMDIIREFFVVKAKKFDKKFQPNDTLCGIRCYFSLELIKPELSGQTKSKLVNRKENLEKLVKKLKVELEGIFNKNPNELESILNFFDDYRKKIDSKKTKTMNTGRRVSTKFTKLADCSSRNGELFIVEGDSAGGSFKQCRNPAIHAILPLKGKIPSVVNKKEILKHKEIGELIEALGTGSGPHFKLENLRYDKIISAPDADEDGKHIFCLLAIALATLVPEVIKAGKFYLAETPLYAINDKKNKRFIPLWTPEELQKARDVNESIIRVKGLGELNPDQLKVCALDIPSRRLIQVNYSSNFSKLLELFSDVNKKRELLDGKWEI